MTYSAFRGSFFLHLVFAKLLVVGWVFFMRMTYGYNFSQLKEIIYIITPIFTAHLLPVISSLAKGKKKEEDKEHQLTVSRALVIGARLFLAAYVIYMIAVISTVPGSDEAFRNMKEMLGWAEILFGVFIGAIISEVYLKQK